MIWFANCQEPRGEKAEWFAMVRNGSQRAYRASNRQFCKATKPNSRIEALYAHTPPGSKLPFLVLPSNCAGPIRRTYRFVGHNTGSTGAHGSYPPVTGPSCGYQCRRLVSFMLSVASLSSCQDAGIASSSRGIRGLGPSTDLGSLLIGIADSDLVFGHSSSLHLAVTPVSSVNSCPETKPSFLSPSHIHSSSRLLVSFLGAASISTQPTPIRAFRRRGGTHHEFTGAFFKQYPLGESGAVSSVEFFIASSDSVFSETIRSHLCSIGSSTTPPLFRIV